MMIASVEAEIDSDVVELRPITLICIEENKIPDANWRQVLDLFPSILDCDHPRGCIVDFKRAPWYAVMGFRRLQSKRHDVAITVAWKVMTIAPNHSNKT